MVLSQKKLQCIHGKEGTCEPVLQCASLVCFWTVVDLYDTEEEEEDISGFDISTIFFSWKYSCTQKVTEVVRRSSCRKQELEGEVQTCLDHLSLSLSLRLPYA